MKTPPLNPDYAPRVDMFALPVVDGSAIIVVNIPKMSAAAFQFFKDQLEFYKCAIVRATDGAAPGDGGDGAELLSAKIPAAHPIKTLTGLEDQRPATLVKSEAE